jgi:hypothetical protein
MRHLLLLSPALTALLWAVESPPSSEVQELTARAQALEARLTVIEATLKAVPPRRDREFRGANHPLLATINLAENPTRAQVQEYVQRIADATRGQTSYSFSEDPQAAMLAKVGAAHLDILLNTPGQELRSYVTGAVATLATDEHKALILAKLPEMQDLASVVLKRQWQNDAKDILRRGLEEESYLSSEWIRAAIKTGDPALHPFLLRYLEEGKNPFMTYGELRKVAGLDLGPSIAKTWASTSRRDRKKYLQLAPIAMAQGIPDALLACLELLADPKEPYSLRHIEDALDKATRDGQGFEWTPAMLKAQPPVITWNATTRQWERVLAVEPAKPGF